MASRPSGRRTAASVRLPLAAPRRRRRVDPSAMYGGLATTRSSAPVGGQRVEPRPAGDAHVGRPPADAGQVGAGDVERVGADVRQPHLTPSTRQLVGQRQADRPEPVPRSATVTGPRQRAGPARWRRRRPPRSPGAGSAPGGRRAGRGGGSPTARARTAAARRRRWRASIASRWATMRVGRRLVEHARRGRRRRSPPRTASAPPVARRPARRGLGQQLAPGDRADVMPSVARRRAGGPARRRPARRRRRRGRRPARPAGGRS